MNVPWSEILPLRRLRYGGPVTRRGSATYLADNDTDEGSFLSTASPRDTPDCTWNLTRPDP